jgi:hypothetical protein
MRTILFVFAALMVSAQVGAMSLNPCTPVVQAASTQMYCRDGGDTYAIQINTMMSRPIPQCQGSNHFETHKATVTLTDKYGKNRGTLQLNNGEFNYKLGVNGDASFSSPKYRLDLRSCVTPIHGGGASFGN